MPRAYRVSLACALLPLAVGVGVFLAWHATRVDAPATADALMLAGIVTIGGGAVCVVVGFAALFVAAARAREAGLPRGRVRRRIAQAAALLVLNVPAAVVLTAAAISIHTRYDLTIRNHSAHPLEDVLVHGGGCELRPGAIRPGETAEQSLRFSADGELVLEASLGGVEHRVVIEGYVTGGLGGAAVVAVRDGTVTVEPRAR